MALWTEIITPAQLTGYARESLADYEKRKGTLAQWLPNRYVSDINVKFTKGATGLVETARFRSYDAEPEIGKRYAGERVTLELPALGIQIPITELEQLRAQNGSNVSTDELLGTILSAVDSVVRSMGDTIEHLRGVVLATGRATITQENYTSDDDFGRPGDQQVTAPTLWTDTTVSRLDYLRAMKDLMGDRNGDTPGCLLMSSRVFRAMAAGNEFKTRFADTSTRSPSQSDVREIVLDADLPPVVTYDRRVNRGGTTTRALPDDRILFLPEPVDPNAWQDTELGATFWGRTLTSQSARYGLAPGEQPGVVVGTWENDKPPFTKDVISDGIALPVLANAALSASAKVL